MSGIWERIVPRRKRQEFFTMPLFQWIFENLGESSETGVGPWSTLFAVFVWWAWKWRCGNLFGDNKLWSDRVKFVKDYAKEVQQLNMDGTSRRNPCLATAGGALRDSNGQWCGGFALNIGRCTAPMAEYGGCIMGCVLPGRKGPQDLKEANRLADGLANYAFSLQLGLHTFDSVPPDLFSVLRDDECGDSIPRHVRV
ncbi:unnamed protein product [Microthlaspi erraticum]|uniref:RNase H type-1 domain-containing protein n=1 Tax=Microthlaspi erraticum TaxID=1685480 RepID=A0A6D2K0Q1_9BRAS|nr:unnamed protein product [Microthlaspi erraticum]